MEIDNKGQHSENKEVEMKEMKDTDDTLLCNLSDLEDSETSMSVQKSSPIPARETSESSLRDNKQGCT